MVIKVPIQQGIVYVTADGKESARRQAHALSRDFNRSARLKMQTQITPGVFALGNEAVRVVKGEIKMPKKKWVKR